jgi:hypothetical protein
MAVSHQQARLRRRLRRIGLVGQRTLRVGLHDERWTLQRGQGRIGALRHEFRKIAHSGQFRRGLRRARPDGQRALWLGLHDERPRYG